MQRVVHIARRLENWLRQHPVAGCAIILALSAILLVSRRPDVIFNAQFWAEDGAVWYTDAYNRGLLPTIFHTYAGYMAVVNRLVAGLIALLPLSIGPLLFNLVALVIQLLPLVLINSSRSKNIIPSRLMGVLVSILYVGALNNTEVFVNLANIQWHLGIAAFLVLVVNKSKSRGWRIFDYSVLIAAGLSGPLILMLVPVAVVMWWRSTDRLDRNRLLVVLGLAAMQLYAIFGYSHYTRVGGQPDADMLYLVKMLVGQIFMGGIVGQKFITFYYDAPGILWILLALFLGSVIYAIVKGPLWLKLLHMFWILAFVSMLLSLKTGEGYDIWEGLTNPTGGQRYWYIPILAWLATLLWLAFKSSSAFFRASSIVTLCFLVFIGLPQGWRIDPLKDLHFKTYASHFEKLHTGKRYTIPINPGWKMTLYKK